MADEGQREVAEAVYAWRLEELKKLGIDHVVAECLASCLKVDLGLARSLSAGGASPEQIVAIVS